MIENVLLTVDSNIATNKFYDTWFKNNDSRHKNQNENMKRIIFRMVLETNFLLIKNVSDDFFKTITELLTSSNMNYLIDKNYASSCEKIIFKNNQLLPVKERKIKHVELMIDDIDNLKIVVIANHNPIIFDY